MPLSNVAKLMIAFSLSSFLLVAIGLCIGKTIGLVVFALGLIGLLGIIIFMVLFYRWPHCGNFLTVWYSHCYCPHYGNRLF